MLLRIADLNLVKEYIHGVPKVSGRSKRIFEKIFLTIVENKKLYRNRL